MIGAEVGERHRAKPHAVDPPLADGVRRHFHRHGIHSLPPEFGEGALENRGLGCRVCGRPGAGGPAHGDTADDAGHDSESRERGVEEVCRARFAVRSGDSMDIHRARRVPMDPGRERAHPAARVLDHQRREVPGRPVAEDRYGAAPCSVGVEGDAVEAVSGQGGVEVARLHGTRVVADAGDNARVSRWGRLTQCIPEKKGEVADRRSAGIVGYRRGRRGYRAVVGVAGHIVEYPLALETMLPDPSIELRPVVQASSSRSAKRPST